MRGMLTLMAMAMGAASAPVLIDGGEPQKPDLAPTATPTPAPAAPELLGFNNEATRMTVPVTIGTSATYSFIIDTGAERTVVSNELAGQLNLVAGRRVRVTTMAGSSELGTYRLSALRVGSKVAPDTLEAPGVEARNLGAPGMLGLDALKDHSLSIDFDKDVLEVRPALKRGRGIGPDDIVIRAKNVYGQLIVTDARYGSQKISVVLDTGSPITVGNLALLKKMRRPKSLGNINMMAVTGQWLTADYRVVDTISIGGIAFNNVPIAFADAVPFKRFGLSNTPALMLGMDTLKLFRKVQIDFANREVRFTLPRGVNAPRWGDPVFHR